MKGIVPETVKATDEVAFLVGQLISELNLISTPADYQLNFGKSSSD
ncbi:hypothetical protein IC229_06785 [Spirosoma sp. BT702]|uniref:Uncharacterized protein n=1 Tax=Spirosoma profusum TaxID=2771354 RepID=A0A927ATI8_9BACT|nr:hypothetical protein [Spirosoma profusum]MBD2700332.1 hypothetical protein [Spirosoma profusum]